MTEQQKAAQAYVEQMGLSKIASFKPSAQSDAPASSGSTTMTRGDGASSGVTGRDVTVSKPVYSPDADGVATSLSRSPSIALMPTSRPSLRRLQEAVFPQFMLS
jgi:hypothetical protein